MAEAKMILARIGKAMALVSKRVLPQSLLGRAINYAQDLWTELNRYVEDGLVEIDNNSVENSIRPSALGKRTGSSSAARNPARIAPSFTPFWAAAIATTSIQRHI